MILADTTIWVDHLRSSDEDLSTKLSNGDIATHPLVIAEIALGSLAQRAEVLRLLDNLPSVPVATVDEIRALVEHRPLFSRGIGFVDAALIASCLLAPGTRLWTRDVRLASVAMEMALGD